MMSLFRKYSSLGKLLSISLTNQFIASGTNFALGIYLVRVLTPQEFGMYGIGSAISLFLSGIGNALFLTQMVVRTPDKKQEDKIPYAARMFVSLSMFSSLLLMVGLILLIVGWRLDYGIGNYESYVCAVVAAAVSYLTKDFFIRHAYNQRQEHIALFINTILAILMSVLLILSHMFQVKINAVIALWIYSLSHAMTAVVAIIIAKLPVKRVSINGIKKDLKELLNGGAYSVLAHIIITVRSQAHTIILPFLLGAVGVAEVNAGRIMISPVAMILPALTQLILPRLSAARASKLDGGRNEGVRYSAMLAVCVAVYSIIILIFYKQAHDILLGDRYNNLNGVVMAWCIYSLFSAYKSGIEMLIIASKKFKEQVVVNLIGMVVSIVLVYIMSKSYGAAGSIAALGISEVVVILTMMSFRSSEIRTN